MNLINELMELEAEQGFEVERIELDGENGKAVAGSFEEADDIMRAWAVGFCKTKFTVIAANGVRYAGRIDLIDEHADQDEILANHMVNHLTWIIDGDAMQYPGVTHRTVEKAKLALLGWFGIARL